ncbi:hypothetical protein GCM10027402_27820 [Arthrobacter monumenti]
MAVTPSHARSGPNLDANLVDMIGRAAIAPPMASSHMRVGVMKYALAGSLIVADTEKASDRTITPEITARAVVVGESLKRRATQNAASKSIGQNR